MLFLALALGPDGDEIEQDKESHQKENLKQLPATLGALPGSLARAAAEAGARNSWLRRWRAHRGLSEDERRVAVEEVCRLDLSHCATLYAWWQVERPGSDVLVASLTAAREDPRRAVAVSPDLLARLGSLYGDDATAGMAPSYELAADLTRVYAKYYHHAAPFPGNSLHAAWERCAARDLRCAEALPRIRGVGFAPPLYSHRN